MISISRNFHFHRKEQDEHETLYLPHWIINSSGLIINSSGLNITLKSLKIMKVPADWLGSKLSQTLAISCIVKFYPGCISCWHWLPELANRRSSKCCFHQSYLSYTPELSQCPRLIYCCSCSFVNSTASQLFTMSRQLCEQHLRELGNANWFITIFAQV